MPRLAQKWLNKIAAEGFRTESPTLLHLAATGVDGVGKEAANLLILRGKLTTPQQLLWQFDC